MNTEEVVAAYLAIRNERDRILKEYEAADEELKKDMGMMEHLLLQMCNDLGADSIKTPEGTVMRRVNERFFCSDWENLYKFVLENGAVHLLEKRIHQGNFRQFIEDRVDEGLPPGVNLTREYAISVRKPSK